MFKDTSFEVSFVMIFNMTPISFWQYFDFISLAVLIAFVGALVILRVRQTKEVPATISHSVASSPNSSLAFSLIMTVFFPLYYCFLWFWLGPYISAPTIFYVLLVTAFLAELIFVWAPASGRTKRIHSVSAAFVGLTMILASIIIFEAGGSVSDAARISIILFWIITVVTALSFLKIYRKHTFIAELLFCFAFLAMISIVAHT